MKIRERSPEPIFTLILKDHVYSRNLLMTPEDPDGQLLPYLRSGLYLFTTTLEDISATPTTLYLIYWPEETSWDDAADESVRRNCVTFIRYLTQLTDEIRVLISPEHASTIVWNVQEDAHPAATDEKDVFKSEDDHDRFFKFEVAKTSEEEENVQLGDGFTVSWKLIPEGRLANITRM